MNTEIVSRDEIVEAVAKALYEKTEAQLRREGTASATVPWLDVSSSLQTAYLERAVEMVNGLNLSQPKPQEGA